MSFDEQPDGDIHGECAAETAKVEFSAFEMWWAMLSKVLHMSKKEIASRAFYAGEMASYELRFDACSPYLKEGETPAECLARNRADIALLMGKLGAEKMTTARLRTALNEILCLSLENTAEAYVIAGAALSTTDHPLNCIHISQGSIAAAADAYEEEYRSAHDGATPRTTY